MSELLCAGVGFACWPEAVGDDEDVDVPQPAHATAAPSKIIQAIVLARMRRLRFRSMADGDGAEDR